MILSSKCDLLRKEQYLLLEILGSMCIVIVCDVINFEILKFTLAFLLRRFHA